MILNISIIKADITSLDSDAIVNAANEHLLPGSGVCGAIFKAAGPELLAECRKIGYCKTGEAVITNGYNLKARKVIHTVGPVFWKDENEAPKLLRNCYLNSLKIADINGVKSIAFPAISTGVYGYPFEQATKIAIESVKSYSSSNLMNEVIFCCYSTSDFSNYQKHSF